MHVQELRKPGHGGILCSLQRSLLVNIVLITTRRKAMG